MFHNNAVFKGIFWNLYIITKERIDIHNIKWLSNLRLRCYFQVICSFKQIAQYFSLVSRFKVCLKIYYLHSIVKLYFIYIWYAVSISNVLFKWMKMTLCYISIVGSNCCRCNGFLELWCICYWNQTSFILFKGFYTIFFKFKPSKQRKNKYIKVIYVFRYWVPTKRIFFFNFKTVAYQSKIRLNTNKYEYL